MIWEFSIFFLTLVYFGALWMAFSSPASFLWGGIIFLLVLLVGVKWMTRKYLHFVIPAFLFVGSVLLLPLIDSPAESKAFLVLSSGVFYLAILGSYRLGKYKKDLTAKAMLNLAALSALFCWFTAIYGWYLNIALPSWIIMIIFVLVTFPVSYALLVINELKMNRSQRVLYSIFLSYLMAVAIWLQNSWPFGYLTTGVIALIIFYSGWDIVRNYFLDRMTIKRLTFSVVFLVGAASLLLLSAKWYPAI
ncbi:MAG: hypothetical protein PHP25_03665 [Candidatus Moranbacteria bacterium]|nr:hypothetical protein [Candidatus Moranbacteria bacterium]